MLFKLIHSVGLLLLFCISVFGLEKNDIVKVRREGQAPVYGRIVAFPHASTIAVNITKTNEIIQAPADKVTYIPRGLPHINGHDAYIIPNELSPIDSKFILEKAPKGVYVSVGTDRGLFGVILATNATHLIWADNDELVLMFNQINLALLKLAQDRVDYLNLRLDAEHDEWISRSDQDPSLDQVSRRILNDAKIFDWFTRINIQMKLPREVERNLGIGLSGAFGEDPYLLGVRYPYDDALFLRVSELAKNDRIEILFLDFSKPKEVRNFVTEIEKRNLSLSVLDLSNAWQATYIGPQKVEMVIQDFEKISQQDSILLLTHQFVGRTIGVHFAYIGASFEELGILGRKKFTDYLTGLSGPRELKPFPEQGGIFNPHSIAPEAIFFRPAY